MTKSELVKSIKQVPLDEKFFIFKSSKALSPKQRESILKELKDGMPKGSTVIILDESIDYIPPDNEALMKRMDGIEAKIDKAMSLIESILAERFKP